MASSGSGRVVFRREPRVARLHDPRQGVLALRRRERDPLRPPDGRVLPHLPLLAARRGPRRHLGHRRGPAPRLPVLPGQGGRRSPPASPRSWSRAGASGAARRWSSRTSSPTTSSRRSSSPRPCTTWPMGDVPESLVVSGRGHGPRLPGRHPPPHRPATSSASSPGTTCRPPEAPSSTRTCRWWPPRSRETPSAASWPPSRPGSRPTGARSREDLLAAEEAAGRVVGRTGGWTWYVPFAPTGVLGDCRAVLPGKSSVLDLDDGDVADLRRGAAARPARLRRERALELQPDLRPRPVGRSVRAARPLGAPAAPALHRPGAPHPRRQLPAHAAGRAVLDGLAGGGGGAAAEGLQRRRDALRGEPGREPGLLGVAGRHPVRHEPPERRLPHRQPVGLGASGPGHLLVEEPHVAADGAGRAREAPGLELVEAGQPRRVGRRAQLGVGRSRLVDVAGLREARPGDLPRGQVDVGPLAARRVDELLGDAPGERAGRIEPERVEGGLLRGVAGDERRRARPPPRARTPSPPRRRRPARPRGPRGRGGGS